MCGIAGIVTTAARPDDVRRLQAAATVMKHRGPDDEGYVWLPAAGSPVEFGGKRTVPSLRLPAAEYGGELNMAVPVCGPGVLLAHNRLSIIDLSPAGHQPMSAENGRVWIVFNGEVYNYRELRDEMAKEGCLFRTQSDTEVVLHALARWGEAALRRFTGMFSFAYYDGRRPGQPTLLLARDPFGIKPLYYASLPGGLAFASEIKGLLALGVPAAPDMPRVVEYTISGQTDEAAQTMFAGVSQVPAAHLVRIPLGGACHPQLQQYWHLRLDQHARFTAAEAAEEFRRLFLRSIALHLRSDVPAGAALSGGLDSSSIVCAVRETAPESEFHSFSYIAEDPVFNEERWIGMAEQQARLVPHRTHAFSSGLGGNLERLVVCQDEPFASTSIYAQYEIFRIAKEVGIKVMLDGQGSDELMAGYSFEPPFLLTALRSGHLSRAAGLLRRRPLLGTRLSLAGRALRLLLPGGDGHRAWPGSKRACGLRAVRPEWRQTASGRRPAVTYGRSGLPHRRELAESLFASSLPMLLRYEDRNSMAFSIESRVPFLTVELAEFVFSLPASHLLDDNGSTKSVLRQAMRGLVPDAILDRRDKIGFQTPENRWMVELGPWVSRLLGQLEELAPFFDAPRVRAEWQALHSGNGVFDYRFWRMINVAAWAGLHGMRLG